MPGRPFRQVFENKGDAARRQQAAIAANNLILLTLMRNRRGFYGVGLDRASPQRMPE
jgi:hypothetical protein